MKMETAMGRDGASSQCCSQVMRRRQSGNWLAEVVMWAKEEEGKNKDEKKNSRVDSQACY